MAAFPFGAPIEDEPSREVGTWPIQKKRQGAIFLLKGDRVGESFVEHIKFGKIGQAGDMIAQHADIERRLEGFPSQVLRRRTITHRLENPDFQARAGEIRYVAWARAFGEIVIGHDLQARSAALANPFERFAMTTGVAQSLGDRHRVAMPVRPALLQGDESLNVLTAVGDRLTQTNDPVRLRALFPVPVRVLDRAEGSLHLS